MGRVALGASDCEALGHGVLGQPANTMSSASYAVVGAWLLASTLRAPSGERLVQTAYAGSLIAVGLGSIAYHGPMPPGAQLAHDLSIGTLLTVVTLANLHALGAVGPRAVLGWTVAGSAGCGLLLARQPSAFRLLGGVAVGLAVSSEAILRRRDGRREGRREGRRDRRRHPQASSASGQLLYRTAIMLLAAGLVLGYLGRTGGPWCRPDSAFQPRRVACAVGACPRPLRCCQDRT